MAEVKYLASLGNDLTDRSGKRFYPDPSLVGSRVKVAVYEADGRVRVVVDRGHRQAGLVFYFPSVGCYNQAIRRELTGRAAERS